jgi:hypothetical protein
MIWSVAPVSAPLKAWNGEPGSTLIATGAPVIAARFAGSVYIAKRPSAGAGRTTDWEMTVRMGHSPRPQLGAGPIAKRTADLHPTGARFAITEALNAAAAIPAYTLSDRGTWLSFKNKGPLKIVVESDPALINRYDVIELTWRGITT